MEIEFFNFIELWKDRYEFFLMDRGIFIDEKGKSHPFAYIYPMTESLEVETIREFEQNSIIKFEVIDLVKNFEIDSDKRIMTIKYPDGVNYTFETEQFAVEESLKLKQRYGKTGRFTPCYRLKVKAKNYTFKDKQFSTSSNIGYTDIITAAYDIFKHKDKMFSKESYTMGVDYPLVIDLAHFEWYIHRFECFRNVVEVEIKSMVNEEMEKPRGTINVEFTNGKYEMREVKFTTDKIKEVFTHNIANVDFYLLSKNKIGFKGDTNIPESGGNVLDHRYDRKYSLQIEDFISLEELSQSDIQRLIDEKENETTEFKSVVEETSESFYQNISKQMTAMANAQSKGLVLVGVTKTGIIEGVGDLSIEEFMNNLQQTLDSHCDPWIDFEKKEFELLYQKEKVKVYVLSLLASKKRRPYLYRLGKSKFEIPLRRGDSTKWLSPKEIKEYMFNIHKEKDQTS